MGFSPGTSAQFFQSGAGAALSVENWSTKLNNILFSTDKKYVPGLAALKTILLQLDFCRMGILSLQCPPKAGGCMMVPWDAQSMS